jgi:hypothetical protein
MTKKWQSLGYFCTVPLLSLKNLKKLLSGDRTIDVSLLPMELR